MYKLSIYNYIIQENSQYLIFNTFTQALVELDSTTYNDLITLNINTKYVNNFLELGFWIDENRNELDEILFENLNNIYNDKCLYITLKLTTDCNFRCSYCYQNHETTSLDENKINIFLKFIQKKIQTGTKEINIHYFGGEPLLNIRGILDIEKKLELSNVNFKSSMTTNGYLLNGKNIDSLRNTNITNLQITLDGTEEEHNHNRFLKNGLGTYNVILDNICNLVTKTNIGITIRCNVNRKNVDSINNLFSELEKRGLREKNIQFDLEQTFNYSNDSNDMFFDSIQEFSKQYINLFRHISNWKNSFIPRYRRAISCISNKSNFYLINPELELESCTTDERLLGKINTDGSVTYYNSYYKKYLELSVIREECKACNILPMCMGGCPLLYSKGVKNCIKEKYILNDIIKIASQG